MNLMKLLSAGQSLKKEKVVWGKYKLQQSLLPKFASTVRPSPAAVIKRLGASAGPAVLANISAEQNYPVESKAGEGPAKSAPRALEKTQKIPSEKVLRRLEDPIIAPLEPGFAMRLVTWSALKISSWIRNLFPVRSKKKSGFALVQTEWSLEKVTVIRNDLSEADLEIIAPKGRAKVEVRNSDMPDFSVVKSSGKKWIKKTTSLFKTTSPFEASPMEKQPETEPAEFAGRS